MIQQSNNFTFSPLGFTPKKWRLRKLKDIATKIGSGATPKGGENVYLQTRHQYALIRSQNVFDRGFSEDGLVYISDAHAMELKGVIVQRGDVLLNITGDGITFGRACLAPINLLPACVNQHVAIIRVNQELCLPEYLLAYLTHPIIKDYIESFNAGGSRRAITKGHIESFTIPIPSLDEQRAITGILGALDEKIELNRRMNRTLESMARAAFHQWFVEGEEVESWKVGTLGDLCESTIGGDWGEEQEFEDSVPVICLRGVDLDNLRKDGYSEDAPIRWIKKSSLEKRQLSNCDILIAGSGIGPVGKPLWVSPEMLKAYSYPVIYSNFVKRFRAKLPEYAVYVDRILFNMRESNEIWDYVNGTSIPNLDDKGLLDYSQTPIPPEDKVKAFYEYIKPIYAKLYNEESRTLASLRDTLLPKLMRGEVRVSAL